jgi:Mce-associated membrane protein
MSVSLYDLLDVDEHATPEQIRSAWKVAISDLDPTDRRFRAYNDAAGVLLDPGKRAAYDAELAAGRDEPEPDADLAAGPVVVEQVADPVDAPADVPVDAPADTPVDAPVGAPVATDADTASSGPPTWALLVAAGAAVLSIALLVVVSSWPGSWGDPSPKEQAESAEKAESAGATAVDAADAAVPAVLSYDYRTLDTDFAEAESYLTDDFAEKRSKLFKQQAASGMTLREQVVSDKVVVTARTSGTGLTRVSEDGDRATVVVYVDQDSQKGKDAPRSLRMWATLSMVADGDDWLLDDICTEDDCS